MGEKVEGDDFFIFWKAVQDIQEDGMDLHFPNSPSKY